MDEKTMVEETEVVTDDTLQEALVEEQDASEPIESAMTEETPAEAPSEPGWIKKRVDKAVQKAVAATEARLQALYEQQMAPLRERQIEYDAKDMVEQGIVKDLDTAKELLRYRMGQAPEKKEPIPKEDPAVSARIKMLQHQADRIKERGIDVIAEFNSNPDAKERIISGEIDFYDLAEEMAKPKKKVVSPMRSPNGASGTEKSSIATMSDEQFERFEKKVSGGTKYAI